MLGAAMLAIGGIMLAIATFGALACWRLSAIIPLAVWGAILHGGYWSNAGAIGPSRPTGRGETGTPRKSALSIPKAAGWSLYSSTPRPESGATSPTSSAS